MARQGMIIAIAALAITSFGCGTAGSLVFTGGYTKEFPETSFVYGGVRSDAKMLSNAFRDAGKAKVDEIPEAAAGVLVTGMVVVIDLPLSAIADTILIPVAIETDSRNYVTRKSKSSAQGQETQSGPDQSVVTSNSQNH